MNRLMPPEQSIRVFVRIAREMNHTRHKWARKGLLSDSQAHCDRVSRDQWIAAARVIKGHSAAYKRNFKANHGIQL